MQRRVEAAREETFDDFEDEKKSKGPKTSPMLFVLFVLALLGAFGAGAFLFSGKGKVSGGSDVGNEGGSVGGLNEGDLVGGNGVGREGGDTFPNKPTEVVQEVVHREPDGGGILQRLGELMQSVPTKLGQAVGVIPEGGMFHELRPPPGAGHHLYKKEDPVFNVPEVPTEVPKEVKKVPTPPSKGRKSSSSGTSSSSAARVRDEDLKDPAPEHPKVGGLVPLSNLPGEVKEVPGSVVTGIVDWLNKHRGLGVELWGVTPLSSIQRTIAGLRLARAGVSLGGIANALSSPAGLRRERQERHLKIRGTGIAVMEFGLSPESALWEHQQRPDGVETHETRGPVLHLITKGAPEAPKGADQFKRLGCDASCQSQTHPVSYWTVLGTHKDPKFLGDPRMKMEDAIRLANERLERWRSELGGKVGADAAANTVLPYYDVIIVRAPGGYFQDKHPGRMQSLTTASLLAGPGTHLFVNDCPREAEKRWTELNFPPAPNPQKHDSLVGAANIKAHALRQKSEDGSLPPNTLQIPSAQALSPLWDEDSVRAYFGSEALKSPQERKAMYDAEVAAHKSGPNRDVKGRTGARWVLLERVDEKLCHYRRWEPEVDEWP